MKNKGLLTLLGGTCLILVLAALPFMAACARPTPAPSPAPAPAPAPKVEEIVLKNVTFIPPDDPCMDGNTMFVNRVNERAKGELRIETLGGPEVVPFFDQAAAVRAGVFDLWIAPTSLLGDVVPHGLAAPLTRVGSPAEERQTGFYDWMVELYKEAGLFYLGRAQWNFSYNLYVNKLIETPQELRELKMRSGPLYAPFLDALGCVRVDVAPAELVIAVDRGLLDGYASPTLMTVSVGLHEVTKYVIDHPFYEPANLFFVMNLDKWNSLPKHLQDLLIDVAIEVEPEIADYYQELREEARQKEMAAGMQRIKFSSANAKWFIDLAYSSTWEELKSRVPEEDYLRLKKLCRA